MPTRSIVACLVLTTFISPVALGGAIGDSIDPAAAPQTEAAMLEVLRGSGPASEKAVSCKLLAIHGTAAAAGELEKLLSDPQLSSWARIALEAIPDPVCDRALRNAAASLNGDLLIGVINSLGVRRDVEAVDLLAAQLKNKAPDVASAAAVALGKIGGPEAERSLHTLLSGGTPEVRSAAAEGCILCAERRLAAGEQAKAVEIYDAVRAANVPVQRVLEATRGAILAGEEGAIPLLMEQLRSPEKRKFQMALTTAREIPGNSVDAALAKTWQKLPPERAALVVLAMADREETVAVQDLLLAVLEGPPPVQTAAVKALGQVGDVSSVRSLLSMARGASDNMRSEIIASLAAAPDPKIDEKIRSLLESAEGEQFALLAEVAGARRIDASDLLLGSLDNSDATVRQAALAALGETISLSQLPVLIAQVVQTPNPEDAAAAVKALKTASIRMADREACAAKLAQAMEAASDVSTKLSLLDVLGSLGGRTTLEAIAAAAHSEHAELQDAATRILGRWMTADAAPVLLELATSDSPHRYQVRALRGYIRIARQFDLSPEQRTAMCQRALDAATRPEEQKMVLEVLRRYPSPENLRIARQAAKISEIDDEATTAVESITESLKSGT